MTQGENEVIDRAIEAAQRHLSDAAGDQSLCALGRSGRPFPAVKQHEGSVAALIALRTGLSTGSSLEAAFAAARSNLARLDRLAARSTDWEAYQAGGLEAIDRIADSLGSGRTS